MTSAASSRDRGVLLHQRIDEKIDGVTHSRHVAIGQQRIGTRADVLPAPHLGCRMLERSQRPEGDDHERDR